MLALLAGSSVTQAQVDVYIDNRSTPEALMASYVNAINRKEYVRAYSY